MKHFLIWYYQLTKYQDQNFTSPDVKGSVFLKFSFGTSWCHKFSCSMWINEKLKAIRLCLINNTDDFPLYYFKLVEFVAIINLALITWSTPFNIHLANLFRNRKTWSIFSLLILKGYKAIIHSQTSFSFFKMSRFPFLQFTFVLSYPNSSNFFIKH